MEKTELLSKLNAIFIDVLDNEEINLELSYSADDVDEWNSLTHIQLIVEIEKIFNVRFTAEEITSFKNVENLIDSLHTKL